MAVHAGIIKKGISIVPHRIHGKGLRLRGAVHCRQQAGTVALAFIAHAAQVTLYRHKLALRQRFAAPTHLAQALIPMQ